jgi:hypothetical protein
MRRGGNYTFKRDIFIWLLILTIVNVYAFYRLSRWKINYTELHRRVHHLEIISIPSK